MTSLEQEIYEKFRQLSEQAQQRLIARLQESVASEFDRNDWTARVNALQADMRASRGDDVHVDVVNLLRDIREDED